MRLGSLAMAGVVGLALSAGYFLLWPMLLEQGAPDWLPWLLVPVAAALFWSITVAPPRRWRAWGYALAGDELHVAYGVWTWVHTIVPLARVQHIDIAQGPIERMFGVVQLLVHTAGTDHAVVILPGITRATAEELRDVIRTHVRSDVARLGPA